jgi:predicted dienelactone hydrolase
MTRRKKVLLSLLAVGVGAVLWGYLYLIKYDIRREHLALVDASRDNRPVPVELAISRRAELKAKLGFKPRVAIVNHGNTVRNTEYAFFGDVLATQGYLVASIQHDVPGDPPLSMQGFPFLGRMPSYQKAEKNILFAIEEIKKKYPDPDFTKITLFGHSQGGDIAMYFAGQHPEMCNQVITLDNIRVPVLMAGKQRILTLRSGNFKPDPGVVPTQDAAEDAGVEVVQTEFQHDHFSDRGPDSTRDRVRDVLARFLAEDKPPKKPSLRNKQSDTVSVNFTPPGKN